MHVFKLKYCLLPIRKNFMHLHVRLVRYGWRSFATSGLSACDCSWLVLNCYRLKTELHSRAYGDHSQHRCDRFLQISLIDSCFVIKHAKSGKKLSTSTSLRCGTELYRPLWLLPTVLRRRCDDWYTNLDGWAVTFGRPTASKLDWWAVSSVATEGSVSSCLYHRVRHNSLIVVIMLFAFLRFFRVFTHFCGEIEWLH